jgi:hypothetical protein
VVVEFLSDFDGGEQGVLDEFTGDFEVAGWQCPLPSGTATLFRRYISKTLPQRD